MLQSSIPLRKLAAAAIVAAGALLLVAILIFGTNDKTATGRSYIQYWALEQQLAHGANPYDPVALLRVERAVGMDKPGVLMSLSPPVGLAYALPLGWVRPGPGSFCGPLCCWCAWLPRSGCCGCCMTGSEGGSVTESDRAAMQTSSTKVHRMSPVRALARPWERIDQADRQAQAHKHAGLVHAHGALNAQKGDRIEGLAPCANCCSSAQY